ISGLINLIVILYISIFVFIKSRKNSANKIFVLLTFASSLWSFGYWRWLLEENNPDIALFWVRILSIGSTWIPILLLQWISLQYKDYVLKKLNKFILIFYYLVGFVFTIYNFSPLYVSSVEEKLFFSFWPNPGILYIFYVIFCYICLTIYAFVVLIKAYRGSYGQIKNQIKYVSIGTFIALIGGFFNFPLWFDIPIPPYGNFFVSLYPIIFTYAIIKYRLMDIRLVISKSILYFILVLLVAFSFTFISFTTAQFFQGQGQVYVTLVVSLIIVIFLDPLKKLLAKGTDTFFYKAKVNYQQVLKNISEIIARELDLAKLSQAIELNLQKELKVKFIKLYLIADKENPNHLFKNNHHIDLAKDDIVLSYLQDNKEIVVTEELPRHQSDARFDFKKEQLQKLEEALDRHQCGLVVPIIVENKLTAVFCIGYKLSGSAFIQEDIDFFGVLGPQVANALERSKLYEKVQEFNIKLQQKVHQATADLEERNVYLMALQKLTNVITRSLDSTKVMQTIADGINRELGFIGGILSFINFKNNTISIGAITQTAITRRVVKMVPRDVTSYAVSLDDFENLASRAINTKEWQAGKRFWDFIKPAISSHLADIIQKTLGAKGIVAVPVYSEQKIIGVIDYVLAKEPEKITNVEHEMMQALADQVGIVFRNLQYYQQIQKANEELKEANIRLQQLDKAKSEFLSIASHQLRTPLTGIKGYLSMIVDGDYGEVPPPIKKVLEEVFLNSDRLTRLVNIFLNVSRIESGRFELSLKETDIFKLIEEVIEELKPEAQRKKLSLIFNKPQKLFPHLMIDRDKIKDVLLNLIDNSIKYTPEGSVEVIVKEADSKLQIAVKDTGVGMLSSEVRELFKKFFRGPGIAQIDTTGSGLGLYIAKKIVEAHQGEIWAESPGKNRGSTFNFTLPLKKK
ncbi:hypothetical protein KKF32_03485, partial [Patescibacteria group bacterium]|nr:hypothetical protein [Patescibacteria group bacterium]